MTCGSGAVQVSAVCQRHPTLMPFVSSVSETEREKGSLTASCFDSLLKSSQFPSFFFFLFRRIVSSRQRWIICPARSRRWRRSRIRGNFWRPDVIRAEVWQRFDPELIPQSFGRKLNKKEKATTCQSTSNKNKPGSPFFSHRQVLSVCCRCLSVTGSASVCLGIYSYDGPPGSRWDQTCEMWVIQTRCAREDANQTPSTVSGNSKAATAAAQISMYKPPITPQKWNKTLCF